MWLCLIIGVSCLQFPFISQPISSQNQEKDITKEKEKEPDNEVSCCYGNNIQGYVSLKYAHTVVNASGFSVKKNIIPNQIAIWGTVVYLKLCIL